VIAGEPFAYDIMNPYRHRYIDQGRSGPSKSRKDGENDMKSKLFTLLFMFSIVSSVAGAGVEPPTIRVSEPVMLTNSYITARDLPPTILFKLNYDSPDGTPPLFWSYLLVESTVDSKAAFDFWGAAEVDFTAPGWSMLYTWDDAGADETLMLTDLPRLDGDGSPIYYLLAFQVFDQDMTASVDQGYGESVHNFMVNAYRTPQLSSTEIHSARESSVSGVAAVEHMDVDPDQRLQFEWIGDAAPYGGLVTDYRWGWDLADPGNAGDPNWAVEAGSTAAHMSTPEISFSSDDHTLTIQCWDLAGAMTQVQWVVHVNGNVGMERPGDPVPEAGFVTRLQPCRPNPFNPSTEIAFSLAEPGHVRLSVFDVSGRLVKTLIDAPMAAGPQSRSWHGDDASGLAVASGLYFLRLESAKGVMVQKALLAK
jgi:FlgD Ig-like domain